ncbi:hypothetical protein EB061_10040, partial [bacterium]|nr:hypothetical protein [bacterium]
WVESEVPAVPVAEGWVANAKLAGAPGLTAIALEQTERVPSLAPKRITAVFNTCVPLKLARPDETASGLLEAVTLLETSVEHEASE